MKKSFTAGLALSACLFAIGCGKTDETPAPPPPPAPKKAEAAVTTPAVTAPPAVTPPPAPAAGGAAAAAAPAAAEPESKEIKDPEGKTLSALQYMQKLADAYGRMRATQVEGNQWPPLTDLQQIVNVGMVKRLPSAPAGQKFVFDAQSGNVKLMTQ